MAANYTQTGAIGDGDTSANQAEYDNDRQARGLEAAAPDVDFEQSSGAVKYSADAATNFVVDVENIAANLEATKDVSLAAVTTASLNSNEAESKFVTKQAVGGSTVKKQLEAAKKLSQSM